MAKPPFFTPCAYNSRSSPVIHCDSFDSKQRQHKMVSNRFLNWGEGETNARARARACIVTRSEGLKLKRNKYLTHIRGHTS